jgi:hypothetical protein
MDSKHRTDLIPVSEHWLGESSFGDAVPMGRIVSGSYVIQGQQLALVFGPGALQYFTEQQQERRCQ